MTADDHQDRPVQPSGEDWVKKRHHPRKNLRLCVTMAHGQKTGEHHARDISLGGIFVETREKLSLGQEVRITLPFSNQNRQIKMNGKVVRVTEEGVGVQFDILDIDIA
ncbi:MAG: PilZ domain-containing protein [Thermodesulfobacteriota bacterium]